MRRAARIDNTAKELIAYAQSIGFDYVPVNGCSLGQPLFVI